jgi:hypothetical protein
VFSKNISDSGNVIQLSGNQLNLITDVSSMSNTDFNEKRIYGPIWQAKWDSICNQRNTQIISVVASGIALDTMIKARLVVEIKENGITEPIHWQAGTLEQDTILPGAHFLLTSVLRSNLVNSSANNAQFRTYPWNPGQENFRITSWHLDIRPQSARYYGIFEPL